MGDLGVNRPHMLIAKNELGIDSDLLVIEGKELRLVEMDEEQAHVEHDIADAQGRAAAFATQAKPFKDQASAEARRLKLKAHEQENSIAQKRYRLLELDEERDAVRGDIEASRQHIELLQREVAQQRDRLKDEKETP